MSEFEIAVNYLLQNEGEIKENPKDPGGIAKYGISLRFLKVIDPARLHSYGLFVGETITEEDIKRLTIDQAKAIYHAEFWMRAPFEQLESQDLCNYVFDMAVNMGISPAIKCLQRAVWATLKDKSLVQDDGILGEGTFFYVNNCGAVFLPALRSERAGDYRMIVEKNTDQKDFIHDWLIRSYDR